MMPFTYREKTVYISSEGHVYFNGKMLNEYNNGTGYMSVSIRSKLFYIHRICSYSFVDGAKEKETKPKL